MTATITMDFTYNQIFMLVNQLPREERFSLYQSLSKSFDITPLKKISLRNRQAPCSFSEEEIVAECKSAWNSLYENETAR